MSKSEDIKGFFVIASDALIYKCGPTIAVVFGKLCRLALNKDYAYISIFQLSEQLGLSENTIRDSISILEGQEYYGSGKSKKTNKYFNRDTALLLDVTPDVFKSKTQVRHYAPIISNFEDFVEKYEIECEVKKQNEIKTNPQEKLKKYYLDHPKKEEKL